MSDLLAHWDCWGSCGMRHLDRPEPNRTPEAAMELLLQKARFSVRRARLGDVDLEAREYGTRAPRVIRFTWRDGVWTRQD
jgi:hypothetical protein